MISIRCVYEEEPSFPATDQHPDAVRYVVGRWFVDAIGGAPSLDVLEMHLGVDAISSARRAIDAEISGLEKAEMAPRFAREAILVGIAKDYMRDNGVDFATAVENLTNQSHADYSAGFTKLKALDDRIRALRSQRPR